MNKIYTRKGDKGETGTFFGRIPKSDLLAEVLGTIDELNSAIGVCRFQTSLDSELHGVQKNLLTIGSLLAGSGTQVFKISKTKHLEKLMDKLTEEMPKLSNFIYPTGSLQLARAICRRAERKAVELGADKNILQYLNRLSDALFTLARFVNYKSGIAEEVWKA